MTPAMMGFAVPFLLFAADLWLHAPIAAPAKHVGLAVSLAATPLARLDLFLAALGVWLALLVVQLVAGEDQDAARTVKAAAQPVAAAAEPPTADALPQEAVKRNKDALTKLLANLDGPKNCDGKPWKLQKDQDGVKVYSSDYPGQSCKRWKVETEIKGPSLDDIMGELFDFDKRVGANGWDTALKDGQVIKSWEEDRFSISRMVTNAAAGGAVSSRELFDLRARYFAADHEACPKDGVLITLTGLDPKKDKAWLPCLPKADKSLVVGTNFPGGGIRIRPVEGKPHHYTYSMINNLALGGWIPASVVNSATSAALLETCQAMQGHLQKRFA